MTAACEQARVAGVRVGMTLAEARAMCAGLTHAPAEPELDHRALEALGRWMTRFSPVVAVESPDCLLIDLTGCERLFGGIEPIARRVTTTLQRMQIAAKIAVAPTVGAAWALTYGSDTGFQPVPDASEVEDRTPPVSHTTSTGWKPVSRKTPPVTRVSNPCLVRSDVESSHPLPKQLQGASDSNVTSSARVGNPCHGQPSDRSPRAFSLSFSLQPSSFSLLPTTSLRLPPSTVATLHHLGVETIGQLLALDRPSLLTRFGPDVLLRIDQLLGRAPEMLRPLEYRTPLRAKMEFDGSVTAIEAIWEVLRRLIDELTQQLARVGGGARRVEAEFRRAYSPPVRKTILLSRATRQAKNLFGLLRCATENLDVRDGKDDTHAADGFYCDGFIAIVVSAPAWERIGDEQWSMDGESEQASAGEVSRLVETLSVRLGPQSVVKTRLHPCHLPERAYKTADGVRADVALMTPTPVPAKKKKRGKGRTFGRMPKDQVVQKKTSGAVSAMSLSGVDGVDSETTLDSRTAHSLPPLAGEGGGGGIGSSADPPSVQKPKPPPQPSPASGGREQEATFRMDAVRQTHGHEYMPMPPMQTAVRAKASAHSNVSAAPFLRLADPYGGWEPLIPDLPDGADDPDRTDIRQIVAPEGPSVHLPLAARPVHLLTMPRELRVMSASGEPGEEQLPLTFVDGRQTHRITHTIGPERIAGLWWEGHDKTRDYYDVESADGKRFWVFRVPQTGRWFLHGEFD